MENTYRTTSGYLIEFQSVPLALFDKIEQQHRAAPRPTYEVKTATGAIEIHEHDQTTVQTDAEKVALAEYETREAERRVAVFMAQLRLCLLRGVRVCEAPAGREIDAWVKEQEFIGLAVPVDPLERQMHFLETEVAPGAEDTIAILAGVSRASGIDERMVSDLEARFRRALGRARGQVARPGAGTDTPESRGLESIGAVPGNGNGHRENENATVDVGFN